MKFLSEFLKDHNKIKEIINISENQAKILHILTQNYFEFSTNITISKILTQIFQNDKEEFFSHLQDFKVLIDLNFIEINQFLENSQKNEILDLLNCDIKLSLEFLNILKSGKFGEINSEILAYKNIFEYLKDCFVLANLYQKRQFLGDFLDEKIKNLQNLINEKIKISQFFNPVEQIFKENSLTTDEKIIFLILLQNEYNKDEFLTTNEIYQIFKKDDLFDGNLFKNNLVEFGDIFIENGEIMRNLIISDEILNKISNSQMKKSNFKNLVNESEIFELIEPKIELEDIVLNEKIKEVFKTITKQLDKQVQNKLKIWGIKNAKQGAKILLFGPAGTGKTISALSLAKCLKKPILSFDCSKILSKWVGESEQNVRKIFDSFEEISQKSKINPVLLLNEADQFLTSRFDGGVSGSELMHNQMQNIFLDRIENFSGILIATTNFIQNLDKAFSRRFDYKIEFKKPNFDERVEIWQKNLPQNADFSQDFNLKELAKFDLSGAQIVLVIKNTALKVAIKDEAIFSTQDFLTEITRELSSDFDDNKKVGLL